MAGLQTKILDFLRSQTFFAIILAIFALESIWIAISAAFPMVFDENMHLGIIQIYAHRLNPLFLHQPAGGDFAGALVHNPSILYHYLMSFPYRLISDLSDSLMVQVIFLRLINVLMFGTGLVLFRRLLLKTKVSPAIINVVILFFILVPVVPLLAGQINYDNLIMPLAAGSLLMATSIIEKIKQKQLPVGQILLLLSLCMLASLVKFEFVPLFMGIVLWLGWQVLQAVRHGKISLKESVVKAWQTSNYKQKLLVGAPLVIATGLFMQIYAVNLVLYHNPLPKCDQILTREQCSHYAPWARDQAAFAVKQPVNANPVLFSITWVYRLFIATFYTSSGGANPATAWYLSINPLPIIFLSALAIFAAGAVLLMLYRQHVFRGYEHFGFLIFVALVYCGMLWLRNYFDFLSVGQKIAINGRYIFPIALPCMLALALCFRQFFGHRLHLKLALVTVVFLLFLQGGGMLSYLTASNRDWYWQNKVILTLNKKAQAVVGPLIIAKDPMPPLTFTSRK